MPHTPMQLLLLLKRPVAYYPLLARVAGGVKAAVMLSQALYWLERTDDPEGWFWKSIADWQDETELSRAEQEEARRRLREAGFWQEARRGMPARLYFRVDLEVLAAAIDAELRKCEVGKDAENPHTSMRESCRQGCGNPADNTLLSLSTESTYMGGVQGGDSRFEQYAFLLLGRLLTRGEIDQWTQIVRTYGDRDDEFWRTALELARQRVPRGERVRSLSPLILALGDLANPVDPEGDDDATPDARPRPTGAAGRRGGSRRPARRDEPRSEFRSGLDAGLQTDPADDD